MSQDSHDIANSVQAFQKNLDQMIPYFGKDNDELCQQLKNLVTWIHYYKPNDIPANDREEEKRLYLYNKVVPQTIEIFLKNSYNLPQNINEIKDFLNKIVMSEIMTSCIDNIDYDELRRSLYDLLNPNSMFYSTTCAAQDKERLIQAQIDKRNAIENEKKLKLSSSSSTEPVLAILLDESWKNDINIGDIVDAKYDELSPWTMVSVEQVNRFNKNDVQGKYMYVCVCLCMCVCVCMCI